MKIILLVLMLTGIEASYIINYRKKDFSIGTGVYMLPSMLNLNKGKTIGYINKLLMSNIDMNIDSKRNVKLRVTIKNLSILVHLHLHQKHVLSLKCIL